LFVVRGPYVSGQSFSNYRSFDFIGVHAEVGSATATQTTYLSLSLPYIVLVLLLAFAAVWWMLLLRLAIIRRRATSGAGFEVVQDTEGASAVRRAN
jgi:hypothetical protein